MLGLYILAIMIMMFLIMILKCPNSMPQSAFPNSCQYFNCVTSQINCSTPYDPHREVVDLQCVGVAYVVYLPALIDTMVTNAITRHQWTHLMLVFSSGVCPIVISQAMMAIVVLEKALEAVIGEKDRKDQTSLVKKNLTNGFSMGLFLWLSLVYCPSSYVPRLRRIISEEY